MEFAQPLSIKTSIKKLTHHILYDGKIEECNKVMANMYGFEQAEDLYGKRLIDLLGAVTDKEMAIATERTKKFVKNNFSVENTISAEKEPSNLLNE